MGSVTLDNVTVSYRRRPAVHHVSGTFAEGSLTAIAGPNGAGKSTLLKAIAGILKADEGSIAWQDHQRHIAYLPQSSDMQRDFPLALLPMVATGFWHRTGSIGAITSAMQDQAAAALATVGLRGFEKHDLASLSHGQFQRALFARLLVQNANLILLDEPFNSVDEHTTARLLELMLQWHQEKRTVLCVLHHFDQIHRHFPDCLLLARECVAWGPTEQALQPENLLRARLTPRSSENPAWCQKEVV